MSTKQFCDRCPNEIMENQELYVLSIVNTKGLQTRGTVGLPVMRSLDLCPHCMVAIKEYLNTDG